MATEMITAQTPESTSPPIAIPRPRSPPRFVLPRAMTPKMTLSRIPPKSPNTSDAMANPLVVWPCGGSCAYPAGG